MDVVKSTPFLDHLLGRLHLLTPAHYPVAGIHGVQVVEGSYLEGLLRPYRSHRGHERNRRRVLTPVQSHLIRSGCRILVHGQDLLSDKYV